LREVPTCHREARKGNCETSLDKVCCRQARGRLKSTEPSRGSNGSPSLDDASASLTCILSEGQWRREYGETRVSSLLPQGSLTGQVWPFLFKTASHKGQNRKEKAEGASLRAARHLAPGQCLPHPWDC